MPKKSKPIPNTFFDTKIFRNRYRYFFQYQFFSKPIPILFLYFFFKLIPIPSKKHGNKFKPNLKLFQITLFDWILSLINADTNSFPVMFNTLGPKQIEIGHKQTSSTSWRMRQSKLCPLNHLITYLLTRVKSRDASASKKCKNTNRSWERIWRLSEMGTSKI